MRRTGDRDPRQPARRGAALTFAPPVPIGAASRSALSPARCTGSRCPTSMADARASLARGTAGCATRPAHFPARCCRVRAMAVLVGARPRPI